MNDSARTNGNNGNGCGDKIGSNKGGKTGGHPTGPTPDTENDPEQLAKQRDEVAARLSNVATELRHVSGRLAAVQMAS